MNFIAFYSFRRACSLDVEVSASGFTKDLERDAAVLHPAGPEEEEEDQEEDQDEETDEEAEREEEDESGTMAQYEHAMLELEGLKVGETNANIDQEEEMTKEEEIPSGVRNMEEREEEEVKEAEDDCPELTDLSSSNREFKPFR